MPLVSIPAAAMRFLWAIFVSTIITQPAHSAEFSGQVVDGLNRPIAQALVEVSCSAVSKSKRERPKRALLRLRSDANGEVRGIYNAALCEHLWVSFEKEGYGAYSSGTRLQYVMRRPVARTN